MRRRDRWIIVIAVVIFGVLFAIQTYGEQGRRLLGRWSFTKSVDVKSAGNDRATYYRLKVNLAYNGEPLDFDIVVGCNVRITTYKDNDRTVEIGVAPMAFGLKMKDGHGVVVRPPEACGGETTENSEVPKALLPLIVTYESAEAPWFGIAYASDEAYDSPLSELKFLGAKISKATREEWEEWRRTKAPTNFVTYELLGINEKIHGRARTGGPGSEPWGRYVPPSRAYGFPSWWARLFAHTGLRANLIIGIRMKTQGVPSEPRATTIPVGKTYFSRDIHFANIFRRN